MGHKRLPRRFGVASALALLVAPLAACGSAAGADEGDPFTVGSVSTGIASRELVAAVDSGYLEEAGFTVSLEKVRSDAQLTPLMANGEAPVAYLTYVTTMTALNAGIPLRMVSGTQRLEPRIQTAWVRADSPIASPADLRGARIGVASVGGFGNVLFGEALAGTGLTLDDVTLTEVAFADMAPALERGDIDVGWLPAPFAAAERIKPDSRLRQIIDFNDVGSLAGLPQGGIAATTEFAEKNPRALAALREQQQRVADELAADPDRDRRLQIQLGGYSPEIAAELPLQVYAGSFTAEDLSRLQDLMITYELLPPGTSLDLRGFVGDAHPAGGA
jgi:NitT/TauT family transport system substrate-binding protein